MNNPKSTALGWGCLIAAAGVSYYWAKQTIDERRAQQAADGSRPTEKLDWRQRIEGASAQEKVGDVNAKTGVVNLDAKSTPVHSEETPAVVGNGVRETK